MSYTAFTFIIFMLVTMLLYFIMPRRARWGVLLAASYLFYFLSSKLLVFSLLATTVSVYLSGLALGRINTQFHLAKKTVPKEEKKGTAAENGKQEKNWLYFWRCSLISGCCYFSNILISLEKR